MVRLASIVLLVGLGAAFFVARTLTKPIEGLESAAKEISEGHLDYRMSDDGGEDELAVLKRRFNEMAARLDETEETKKRFVSSFTHDLKNPLASIKAVLGTLDDEVPGKLNEKQKKYLSAASESSERMWAYIDDILAFMKLDSGQLPISPISLSPYNAVFEALEEQRPKAERYGLTLTSKLKDGLPDIKADPALLRRVFDNLISNALDFTPKGGEVMVLASQKGDKILFEVKDTGPGIPKMMLTRIFETFGQVEEIQEKRRGTGTGLGLAISRRIVEDHGGTIEAKSRPGKGARFLFTLPKA